MGILASRPTELGVPPRSTAIVDACTPLASAAEGDKWRPTWGDRIVSDFQITKLLPTGCGRMPVMVRGETPASSNHTRTAVMSGKFVSTPCQGNVIIQPTRMSINAEDADEGDEEERLQTGPLLGIGSSVRLMGRGRPFDDDGRSLLLLFPLTDDVNRATRGRSGC